MRHAVRIQFLQFVALLASATKQRPHAVSYNGMSHIVYLDLVSITLTTHKGGEGGSKLPSISQKNVRHDANDD
jgi:hypothetical protein